MKPAVEITAAPAATPAAREIQNWILWSACLGAVVVYALVPAFVTVEVASAPPPFLVPVLAVVAAWTAVASVALRHWRLVTPARRGELDPREPTGAARFRTISLVNWVLSETVGLYGLVVAFLGGSDAASLAFFGGSALLLLLHAPRGAGFRPAPSVEDLARSGRRIG